MIYKKLDNIDYAKFDEVYNKIDIKEPSDMEKMFDKCYINSLKTKKKVVEISTIKIEDEKEIEFLSEKEDYIK